MEQALLETIKSFAMRLEFIHPNYLPPLKESFLRKDFNFCQYLAYAYGKTLKTFFNTSWVALLVILIVVDLAKVVVTQSNEIDKSAGLSLISILPPAFFLVMFTWYFYHFRRIEKQLYPQIQSIS